MDYNKIASLYAGKRRTSHPIRKRAYREWLRECNKEQWKMALDLGCGSGHSTRILAKTRLADIGKPHKTIFGIDNSLGMIRQAQKVSTKANRVCYLVDDIFNDWEFIPNIWRNNFELAASFAAIHYATDYTALENLFSNINKCLCNTKVGLGSRVVATLLDLENPAREYVEGASSYSRWLGPPFQEGSRVETILLDSQGQEICPIENFYWPKKTYGEAMMNNGFSDIKWKSPKYIKKMGLILLTARKGV